MSSAQQFLVVFVASMLAGAGIFISLVGLEFFGLPAVMLGCGMGWLALHR